MEDIQKDVVGNSSPEVSEDPKTPVDARPEEPVVPKESVTPEVKEEILGEPATPKGTKTPEPNLYAALNEEREKRKAAEAERQALEEELETIKSSVPSDYSDEGDELKKRIDSLEDKIELKDVQATYPALRDKAQEFAEFRKQYPRHKLENVAKLFLVEEGLLEAPQRKSLEKPTGGSRIPSPSGMSAEEISDLRQNNFRKYQKLLLEGKIQI